MKNVCRIELKISIQGSDELSLGLTKARVKSGRLSVVASKMNDANFGMVGSGEIFGDAGDAERCAFVDGRRNAAHGASSATFASRTSLV